MQLRSLRAVPMMAALVVAAACGSDSSTSLPTAGAPARLLVTSSPAASASVGASAGTFSVKVTDQNGVGVTNVLVTFGTTGALTATPRSATTDVSGVASTQLSAGTVAGAATVTAVATGVSGGLSSTVSVIPGSATMLAVSPKALRFTSVGDTARIAASVQDQFGNQAGTAAVTYTVVDPSLVSVDAAGLVRVLRLNGSTWIIAAASGKSDTTAVTVLAAGASLCTGLASVTAMNVGDIRTLTGAQYQCLNGGATGAEFALVAFNSSTDQINSLALSVTADGVATPPSSSIASTSGALALRSATNGGTLTAAPQMDEQFHIDLLQRANQQFKGALARMRAARQMTASSSISTTGLTPTRSASIIPSAAKVGDLITMNVSANMCTGVVNHAMRVEAIGSRSIVLSDTLNPVNGFATADFSRVAANFDTLVYSLDVGAFGAPSDMDSNGKVAILFTRTVNELVNSTSGYFVGGFFNPRDLFPKKGATAADDCPGSNEGEMFYMLVPAPSPGINGVVHTVGFVDSLTTGVVAHEFQHLINAGRRMYVNTGANDFEEPWLNEGLSHIAEELLYYRESGFSPRQNLDDATIRVNNRSLYGSWKSDASANFSRFLAYLRAPESNSPYANDDELPTRGAAWSFLRYAADRLGSTDGTIWQRFDNATTTGLATLKSVLGQDPAPLFRDWAVANYVDDLGTTTDARYLEPSWNFRSIYTTTFLNTPTYPLKTTMLSDKAKVDLQIRGGSAAYLRLAAAAGKDALLNLSSGGAAPSAPLQFIVIRTK